MNFVMPNRVMSEHLMRLTVASQARGYSLSPDPRTAETDDRAPTCYVRCRLVRAKEHRLASLTLAMGAHIQHNGRGIPWIKDRRQGGGGYVETACLV